MCTFKDLTFPKIILIDNTNACNLRCSMCDHARMGSYRQKMKLDIKFYEKIIDEISVNNRDARVWEIFFGDPFLCSDISSRVKYAKDKGLTDVVVNSNGVLMTPARSESIIKAGLDAMYVGIDAFAEATYNKIRVGGNFELAKQNILVYRDLLKKFGNGSQKLFVQFVVCDENTHEQEKFIDFWKSNEVNVKIRPRVSWAGLVAAPNLKRSIERAPCYWLSQSMSICSDGTVALCAVDVHRRVHCGSIVDHSIKEIWNAKLKEYREKQYSGDYRSLPEMCANCLDWQSAYAEYK